MMKSKFWAVKEGAQAATLEHQQQQQQHSRTRFKGVCTITPNAVVFVMNALKGPMRVFASPLSLLLIALSMKHNIIAKAQTYPK